MWFLISILIAANTFADPFGDQWYQGKAEITSYDLNQARYGEIRSGHSVFIFVTEDFSNSKHVKLDRPNRVPEDAVKVLKLNATRNFVTGIYPYSMMTSVFTPVYSDRHPRTLKVTTSSQEWCGHTFTQLNLTDDGYRAKLYSYFERESDRDMTWSGGIPEDELWNRVRLSPDSLPVGKVRLIPGTIFQRLQHSAWGVFDAVAERSTRPEDADLSVYTVTYPQIKRRLSITYRTAFPHEIESWEETERLGTDREMTTTAKLRKRMMSPYWQHNDLDDEHLRKQLGLE